MLNKVITTLALGLLLGPAACTGGAPTPPPLEGARMGGPFTLIDQNGKQVSDTDFAGRYRLVYFGYTYCPAVCPTDMARLMNGLKKFEEKDATRAAKIQPIFISIDPARDTPEARKAFVAAFHPRLIGLSGTPAQLEELIKRYGGYFAMGKKRPDGQYDFDHTTTATLYGPKGEPITLLPQDQGPDAVAATLDQWVK